jgi:hypothetical protein
LGCAIDRDYIRHSGEKPLISLGQIPRRLRRKKHSFGEDTPLLAAGSFIDFLRIKKGGKEWDYVQTRDDEGGSSIQ